MVMADHIRRTLGNFLPEAENHNVIRYGHDNIHLMLNQHNRNSLVPDFHNTPRRVEQLEEAIREDRVGRAGGVIPTVEEIVEAAKAALKEVK